MPNCGESYPEGNYYVEDRRTPEQKTKQRMGKLVSNIRGVVIHRRKDDTKAFCGAVLGNIGYDIKLPLCETCERATK